MTFKLQPGQNAAPIQSGGRTSMMTYQAALANRFFARCNICVIGDSVSEGQGATAVANRWVNRLADGLRLRYPVGGITGGQGFLPPQFATNTLTQPAVTGSPGTSAGFGPGQRCYTLAGTATITYTVTGTSIDVMWVQGSGAGTLGVSIDGGPVSSIAETNATLKDGNLTRFTFGAPGTHTVKFSAVSGTAYLDGIIVYYGDESAGVMVHDCSHFGYTLHTYMSVAGDMTSWLNALSPSLVIVELGINDYGGQQTLANFATDLNTLASTLNGLTSPPSVLLLADYDGYHLSGITWQQYVAQYYALAQTNNYAILDLSQIMPAPNASRTYGLYYTDNLHPSNLGHSFIGDTVCQALQAA